MLTLDTVERALPANLKSAATQELVDQINNAVSDPILAEQIRNNFISYTSVLRDGKYRTEDYLKAVMYVSYKLMGDTNKDAYLKTFPDRHQALVARGATDKDISAYVSAYSKGKLVNAVMESTLVPSWVLNQDIHQRAINRLAHLMVHAQSEKVQSDSAAALLTHLGKPKEAGPLINIDMRPTDGMNEMKEMLQRMAQMQQAALSAGVSAKDIAAQPLIIQGECTREPR